MTEKVIVGVIEEVNPVERYFVVNSTKIAIREQWKGCDGMRYNWEKMPVHEITINGKTFTKGR